MKKTFLFLHKWLGLLNGLILLILSLTGALFIFSEEIKVAFESEKYYIENTVEQSKKLLPISELQELAQNAIPKNEKISRVEIYPAKDRTWIFRAQKMDKTAIGYSNYISYYKKVFINPYTGEVQRVENTKNDFFQIIIQLHMNLLLGKKIGQPIIIVAVLLFIIIALSGIYLWWPKKWKRKKITKHFKIELKKNWKWKKKNFDFHRVLGFYSSFFILLLSITGLVFASPLFKEQYKSFFNKIAVSQSNDVAYTSFEDVPQKSQNTFDNALDFILKQHPNADKISVRLRDEQEKNMDFQVRIEKNKSSVFNWYYFNKVSGQISELKTSDNQVLGDKMESMNYDLHTGSLGGIYTKILYLIFCLICFSLPITGFVIYLNKRKKI